MDKREARDEVIREVRRMAGNEDWTPPKINWKATPLLAKVREIGLTKVRAESELQNMPVKRADEIREKMADALRFDVPEMMAAERSRLMDELDAERVKVKDWKTRHREEVEADVRTAERRFRAMSTKELKDTALKVMAQEVRLRAEELDVLSCELRTLAPKDHELLREAIVNDHLADEARFTETGARIVRQLEALDKPGYQDGAVPVFYDDGRIVSLPLMQAVEEAIYESE